jgi:hypothetical protein
MSSTSLSPEQKQRRSNRLLNNGVETPDTHLIVHKSRKRAFVSSPYSLAPKDNNNSTRPWKSQKIYLKTCLGPYPHPLVEKPWNHALLCSKTRVRNLQQSGFTRLFNLIWLFSFLKESSTYKTDHNRTRAEILQEIEREFNQAIALHNVKGSIGSPRRFLDVCHNFKKIGIKDDDEFETLQSKLAKVVYYILWHNLRKNYIAIYSLDSEFDERTVIPTCENICPVQLRTKIKQMIHEFLNDHCKILLFDNEKCQTELDNKDVVPVLFEKAYHKMGGIETYSFLITYNYPNMSDFANDLIKHESGAQNVWESRVGNILEPLPEGYGENPMEAIEFGEDNVKGAENPHPLDL